MLDPDVFSQHAPLIRRNLGTNFTHPSFSSLSLSLSLALRDLCRSPIRITAARMPAFLLWHRPLDSDMPAASAGAKKQFGRQLFQGWAFLGVCWIPSSEAAESSQPAPSPPPPPLSITVSWPTNCPFQERSKSWSSLSRQDESVSVSSNSRGPSGVLQLKVNYLPSLFLQWIRTWLQHSASWSLMKGWRGAASWTL